MTKRWRPSVAETKVEKVRIPPFITATLCILTVATAIVFCFIRLALGDIASETPLSFAYTIWTIAIVVIVIDVVFEFVANFFNKAATWNTFMVALSLLFYLLTLPEAKSYFSDKITSQFALDLFRMFNILFYGLFCVFFSRYILQNYLPELRRNWITISGFFVFTVTVIVGAILSIWKLEYIVIWLAAWTSAIVFTALFMSGTIRMKDDLTFYISFIIAALLVASETSIGILTVSSYRAYPYGLASGYIVAAGLMFLVIYTVFTIRVTKSANRAEIYKSDLEALQTKILREQINPHFFFNVLNHIKVIYRKSPEEGDRAIDLLSKHLRANVAASDVYLVPLSTELENITYYLELASLGYERKPNVIFNVENYDFDVPTLSLQPFVENAIRYSQITSREGGYIEISSEEMEHEYILKIIDNGVGFDVNSIKTKSQGIKNASDRFKLLLNADVQITSKAGEGTTVTIKIPKRILKGGGTKK